LVLGDSYEALFVGTALLIAIWLFGGVWGQRQAARGDCSLMRWRRQQEYLAALPMLEGQAGKEAGAAAESEAEALVEIIRFSNDPEERRKALLKLDKLGMVERL
jgi:hypothetical protein